MVATITIEGIKVRGKPIPRTRLVLIWSRLSKKPFPLVAAFQLEDRDFSSLMKSRKCRDDKRREMLEWGRVLSAKGTDACIFNVDDFSDVDYIILVRKTPYHNLNEILEHEMSHIVKGDL